MWHLAMHCHLKPPVPPVVLSYITYHMICLSAIFYDQTADILSAEVSSAVCEIRAFRRYG